MPGVAEIIALSQAPAGIVAVIFAGLFIVLALWSHFHQRHLQALDSRVSRIEERTVALGEDVTRLATRDEHFSETIQRLAIEVEESARKFERGNKRFGEIVEELARTSKDIEWLKDLRRPDRG